MTVEIGPGVELAEHHGSMEQHDDFTESGFWEVRD